MSAYFDHAATAPIREVAAAAWAQHAHLLNAGGQYASGRKARAALEGAREQIAHLLGAEPIEVIFCGSGTEADNIALQGLWEVVRHAQPRTVVASRIEHPAVLEPVRALEHRGAKLHWLPVRDGAVCEFEQALGEAALATLMWANNETGAVQPVESFIEAAGDTPVHVDAVQAVGHVPVDFHALGATTMAASAHKFGGPKGVGLLLARRSPAPAPVLLGGGQERGIRSGTHDVAGAVATAAALQEACDEMHQEQRRLAALRDQLMGAVRAIDNTVVHTPASSLPGHVHASFCGAEADSLIMLLDYAGFEASTGSACAQGVNRASEVLLAQGVDERTARSAIRFTLGPATDQADVDALCQALPTVVERARLAGMA